jgi:LPXTG-site transpeptidase (sortase) family protein
LLRFGAAAMVLALLGVLGFVLTRKEEPAPTPASAPAVVTTSTDTPDEQKPSANTFVWKGGAADPKYIRLPTINAEGFMQGVGIDQRGAVAVPNNIHMAGWFAESMRPGEPGLSIIDGHVDGRQNDGIFKNLIKLQEGDEFTVTFGNETVKRFRVKKVSLVEAARSAAALFSRDVAVPSQLNLITCGGTFDQQTKLYDKRVIVVAELVG